MLNFFKQIPVYIKICTNKIEITNLKTGEIVFQNAIIPFSTSRIVVSSFVNSEQLIRSILNELGIAKSQLKVLIQQMENVEGGLADIEKRAMRDLGEQAGGSIVILVEHTRVLNNEEALLQLKNKSPGKK